jgi:hypothetical protein
MVDSASSLFTCSASRCLRLVLSTPPHIRRHEGTFVHSTDGRDGELLAVIATVLLRQLEKSSSEPVLLPSKIFWSNLAQWVLLLPIV